MDWRKCQTEHCAFAHTVIWLYIHMNSRDDGRTSSFSHIIASLSLVVLFSRVRCNSPESLSKYAMILGWNVLGVGRSRMPCYSFCIPVEDPMIAFINMVGSVSDWDMKETGRFTFISTTSSVGTMARLASSTMRRWWMRNDVLIRTIEVQSDRCPNYISAMRRWRMRNDVLNRFRITVGTMAELTSPHNGDGEWEPLSSFD